MSGSEGPGTTELPAWHHQVEGCTNFRDAGGWPTTDGRRMVTGRLYRSDGPLRVTDGGRRAIAALGVARVVDLRQQSQFERTPGFLPPASTTHVPLVDRVIDTDQPPPLDEPADFAALYDGMLDASREPLALAVDVLARGLAHGPVLVHCSYGKDRAGLAVAVIQAAIGVVPSAIAEEYARSDAPAMRRHDWMLNEPWPGDVDLRTVPTELFRAYEETMSILLDRVVERHGSLEAWIASFPFHADTLQGLRDALLE